MIYLSEIALLSPSVLETFQRKLTHLVSMPPSRLLVLLLLLSLFALLLLSHHTPVSCDDAYDYEPLTPSPPPPSEPAGLPQHPRSLSGRLDTTDANDETIFVSVASFRDPECVDLVNEIFVAALNPSRVVLGIIEQNEPGDPICIPPEFHDCRSAEFCPIDNIKRRRVASRNGKGPTYGRYVSFLLYRGERYYMMIDSHTGFIRLWDQRVILQLQKSRSPRPVLSQYPHAWKKHQALTGTDRESSMNTAVMCNGRYLEHGFIRLVGMMIARRTEPYPAPFAAAGFMFSDARLVREVPFDPLLDFVFDGEEILYSTRLFTAGYNVFAPNDGPCLHHYGRKNFTGIKFHAVQTRVKGSMMNRAVYWARRRIQYFLQVTEPNRTTLLVPRNMSVSRVRWQESRYGLGRRRSLSSFNAYAMIDPIHRIAPLSFCALLGWQNKKV
jgi:UDP-GlcNAc:polypeptide alpha-N-acetylglucosaminyltransferase